MADYPDTPVSREEIFLAKIAEESVTLPEPVTRRELFLAKIAGQDVKTPEPVSREEQYLNYIAEHGGGGGGEASILSGTDWPSAAIGKDGDLYLRLSTAINVFGTPTQNITPDVIITGTEYTGYELYKAFGDNSGWLSNGVSGTNTVNFSSSSYIPQQLSFVDAWVYSSTTFFVNAQTVFRASNDGIVWDTLYVKSTTSKYGEKIIINLQTGNAYSKFRFDCKGPGSLWCGLKNVVLAGADPKTGASIVFSPYCKINNAWADLIGANIDDVGM